MFKETGGGVKAVQKKSKVELLSFLVASLEATSDILFVYSIFGLLYYCIVKIGRRATGSRPGQDLSIWCLYLEGVFIRKPCATHYINNCQ